jgi:hypothetical protein
MPVQYGGDRITFSDGSNLGSGWTGFKNRIINGDMSIDQRNAGASVTGNDGVYGIDRFVTIASQSSRLTVQQNQGSVTPPAGFRNYLGYTSSSAYSITSTDYFGILQHIEGFNTADFSWGTASATPVTLSFWVRSSLTGTFGGAISNGAQNRCYPFSYTISAANTWEQKSITIAGDTSGTWLTTNGRGLSMYFSLGIGSTYSGTAGAWSGTTFYSATGATSLVGTNGATFYITGVQLERGSTATNFDYLDYGSELRLCQRYYEAGGTYTTGTTASSALGRSNVCFKETKRATPTINLIVVAGNTSGFGSEYVSTDGISMSARGSAVGDVTFFNFTASSEL